MGGFKFLRFNPYGQYFELITQKHEEVCKLNPGLLN